MNPNAQHEEPIIRRSIPTSSLTFPFKKVASLEMERGGLLALLINNRLRMTLLNLLSVRLTKKRNSYKIENYFRFVKTNKNADKYLNEEPQIHILAPGGYPSNFLVTTTSFQINTLKSISCKDCGVTYCGCGSKAKRSLTILDWPFSAEEGRKRQTPMLEQTYFPLACHNIPYSAPNNNMHFTV
jgi:hypothetical protein